MCSGIISPEILRIRGKLSQGRRDGNSGGNKEESSTTMKDV